MGVPTSEVGYTSAMPRREDHEVRKRHVGHWIKKMLFKKPMGMLKNFFEIYRHFRHAPS